MPNPNTKAKAYRTPEGLIKPEKQLKEKVPGTPGPPDKAMLKRIDERIQQFSADFPNWAKVDILKLRNLLTDTNPHPQDHLKMLHNLFLVAHEMRGQGGSFGYPLISDISSSLCRFAVGLRQLDDFDDVARALCLNHVDAMHQVITNYHQGIGHKIDREVTHGLQEAVKVYANRHNIELEA